MNASKTIIFILLFTLFSQKHLHANDSIKITKPLVFSHRGNSFDTSNNTIENTLPAFQSIDQYVGIECDVRLTKDKQVVVIHDDNLSRMTNNKYKTRIDRISAKELLKIDLTDKNQITSGKIPLLSEVLNKLDTNKRIIVEIKNLPSNASYTRKDIAKNVVIEINNHDKTDQVIVSSFDPLILREVRRLNPNITRCLLAGYKAINNSSANCFAKLLLNSIWIPMLLCKPKILAVDYKDLNRKYIKAHRSKDIKIFSWGEADTIEKVANLMELDIDGIITDYPELANEVITTYQ